MLSFQSRIMLAKDRLSEWDAPIRSKSTAQPEDINQLRQAVVISELEAEKKFLMDLFSLNNEDEVRTKFIEHCRTRAQQNKKSFLSFFVSPEGLCNSTYWQIARILFNPQSLSEMLAILLPYIKNQLVFDVEFKGKVKEDIEERRRKPTKKELCEATILKSEPLSKSTATCPESSAILKQYIYDGENTLFNVNDIPMVNFDFHALIYRVMQLHETLYNSLYQHNEDFRMLQRDVRLYQNKGITPRVMLERMVRDLTLGDKQHGGSELEAGQTAVRVYQEFLDYLNDLPKNFKDEFLALHAGTVSVKSVENKLKKITDMFDCAFQAHGMTSKILEANHNNPFLDKVPELSEDDLQQIKEKYKAPKKLSSVGDGANATTDIPEIYLKQNLQGIYVRDADELWSVLRGFSKEMYEHILPNVSINPTIWRNRSLYIALGGSLGNEQRDEIYRVLLSKKMKLSTEHQLNIIINIGVIPNALVKPVMYVLLDNNSMIERQNHIAILRSTFVQTPPIENRDEYLLKLISSNKFRFDDIKTMIGNLDNVSDDVMYQLIMLLMKELSKNPTSNNPNYNLFLARVGLLTDEMRFALFRDTLANTEIFAGLKYNLLHGTTNIPEDLFEDWLVTGIIYASKTNDYTYSIKAKIDKCKPEQQLSILRKIVLARDVALDFKKRFILDFPNVSDDIREQLLVEKIVSIRSSQELLDTGLPSHLELQSELQKLNPESRALVYKKLFSDDRASYLHKNNFFKGFRNFADDAIPDWIILSARHLSNSKILNLGITYEELHNEINSLRSEVRFKVCRNIVSDESVSVDVGINILAQIKELPEDVSLLNMIETLVRDRKLSTERLVELYRLILTKFPDVFLSQLNNIQMAARVWVINSLMIDIHMQSKELTLATLKFLFGKTLSDVNNKLSSAGSDEREAYLDIITCNPEVLKIFLSTYCTSDEEKRAFVLRRMQHNDNAIFSVIYYLFVRKAGNTEVFNVILELYNNDSKKFLLALLTKENDISILEHIVNDEQHYRNRVIDFMVKKFIDGDVRSLFYQEHGDSFFKTMKNSKSFQLLLFYKELSQLSIAELEIVFDRHGGYANVFDTFKNLERNPEAYAAVMTLFKKMQGNEKLKGYLKEFLFDNKFKLEVANWFLYECQIPNNDKENSFAILLSEREFRENLKNYTNTEKVIEHPIYFAMCLRNDGMIYLNNWSMRERCQFLVTLEKEKYPGTTYLVELRNIHTRKLTYLSIDQQIFRAMYIHLKESLERVQPDNLSKHDCAVLQELFSRVNKDVPLGDADTADPYPLARLAYRVHRAANMVSDKALKKILNDVFASYMNNVHFLRLLHYKKNGADFLYVDRVNEYIKNDYDEKQIKYKKLFDAIMSELKNLVAKELGSNTPLNTRLLELPTKITKEIDDFAEIFGDSDETKLILLLGKLREAKLNFGVTPPKKFQGFRLTQNMALDDVAELENANREIAKSLASIQSKYEAKLGEDSYVVKRSHDVN